ncbi:Dph6-related ATP pyrophosphatase [Cesiribacter andamanensis]|uniref:Diphthamide synthase domain-containing protein n=1 Tax=Cesiribacter andamanensis AMV16 TaxID=1279009 RepID=M7N1Q7_9BACT|nr:hypothetical protein [Cesiribacter andamanensis]EMR01222.1 hypothetical protein ADICEAN_03653 [Cesiribacter andamanensis AMV16]
MTRPKVSISWSSGKDAALAFYKTLQTNQLEVVHLHTTLSTGLRRVGMHGTPAALVEAQARAIGLPLSLLEIPADATNAAYEKAMLDFYAGLKAQGVEGVVFGDIYLEDLRTYREGLLQQAGLQGYYPLWQLPTNRLAAELLQEGISAVVCAASTRFFGQEAVGRAYDAAFIAGLPQGCDPCGEQGEFHTFVTHAPYFSQPVPLQLGRKVLRHYALSAHAQSEQGMWFIDLAEDKG